MPCLRSLLNLASCVYWHDALRRTSYHFYGNLSIEGKSKFNHEEILDKSTLRKVLQNNCPACFKNTKVMKDKERLRDPSRLKETNET